MDCSLLTLLQWVAVLAVAVSGAMEDAADNGHLRWADAPLVVDRQTVQLQNPNFSNPRDPGTVCGIECQRNLPEPGPAELEQLLSYETLFENGTRTLTQVALQGLQNVRNITFPAAASSPVGLNRRKRQVYGMDGRFVITDKHFVTSYPFSASVKLSTGCSGILVSPKHVLTAAHCVHNGQDYLKGSRRLRVGVMKLRSKRGSGERGGKKSRRREMGPEAQDLREHGGEKRKRKKERKEKNRARRSAGIGQSTSGGEHKDSKQPGLRWTRVKQTYIPKGWTKEVGNELALDYDYALLELKRAARMKHMDLGVLPLVKKASAARVHFSGYDDDYPGKVVYRFCSISEESKDLMYQYCDAQQGSSGAGVYVRLSEPARSMAGKRKWRRKVIAIFSGHKWVDVNGKQRDYNVAVRITPAKFAQICHWIHGDSKKCNLA
ncbi:inactive serine protease 35-like [Astyanax mexicanus]|uniref:Inactive serine protease 35 n=1 Tax=Astyanax mexicanus TaxID=7994 RepID=A0A8B9L2H0_ASTMX|nr:inactive serine protease 35-like [Astyanax mexicanus]